MFDLFVIRVPVLESVSLFAQIILPKMESTPIVGPMNMHNIKRTENLRLYIQPLVNFRNLLDEK